MKTKFFLFVSLFVMLALFQRAANAQTRILNGQEVSGKWTLAGSPYKIEGEAIVPTGATLTIEPGVVVKFQTGTNRDYEASCDVGFLRVNGKLKANGKKDKPIIFTRMADFGYWGVVYLDHPGSEISYCAFQYGWYVMNIGNDDNATAALSFYGCEANVHHCVIGENGWTGINVKGGSKVKVSSCILLKNKYAVEANSNSSVDLTKCLFLENEELIYTSGGGSISLSNSKVDIDEVEGANIGPNVLWNTRCDANDIEKLGIYRKKKLQEMAE